MVSRTWGTTEDQEHVGERILNTCWGAAYVPQGLDALVPVTALSALLAIKQRLVSTPTHGCW